MANVAFRVTNSNGMSGRAWSAEYETRGDAGEAIRQAMGWDGLFFSEAFGVTEEGKYTTAFACYETEEERDEDQDGAGAPRIIRVEVAS